MGGLAAHAGAHGRHEDAGGGQEGQVALQFAVDHGREGTELVEDGEEGFELAVEGEEGIGKRDAADDGAENIALVPLLAGEVRGHGEVAAEDDLQAADALAGAGVHLVRHGGRADLAFLEAFGDGLVAGHQADGGGQRGRGGAELH